jgi:hypothetical protein
MQNCSCIKCFMCFYKDFLNKCKSACKIVLVLNVYINKCKIVLVLNVLL